jgi:hypothetical protein
VRHLLTLAVLLWTVSAQAQPEIVAVYGAARTPADGVPASNLEYQVRTAGLDGVREGSILIAYRRVPAARGDAPFRYEPVWLESGRLQVTAIGPRWVTARQVTNAPRPPLPALDDDGLPLDQICIGDRVLESGQVGLTESQVVGRFDLELLFPGGGDDLETEAQETLRLWLSRFGVLGAVQVDVSVPGAQTLGTGEPPTTDERITPLPLRGDHGWAEVHRGEEDRTLAQRRARRLSDAVEAVLGMEDGRVLATVSWVGEGVSEPGTATIRLGHAGVLPAMRPGQGPTARATGLGEAP